MRAPLRALLPLLLVAGLALSAGAAPRKKGARPPEKEPEAAPVRATPPPSSSKAAEPETGGDIKRGERIEFDERLIQGQTAKAGALYLFDRKPSDLRSMVHERSSYRAEIVREIFPDEEEKP